MVISARVRVPVLSVAITVAEPSVSTDASFFSTAWRLAMRCTPSASTTERIAGRPSGTAATASDTPSSSTRTSSCVVCTGVLSRMVPTTTAAITTAVTPSTRPTRATSRCSGVGGSSVASSRVAMPPTSVCMPTAVTTPRPLPCATAVPLNTMFRRSPSAAGAARVAGCLRTASLSPVSEASSTCSSTALASRASAPTAIAFGQQQHVTHHQGGAGHAHHTTPSRSTLERACVSRARAATALCALRS